MRTLLTILAVCALCAPTFAGNGRVAPKPIKGSEVAKNVKTTLTKIKWHRSLEEARAAAAKSKKMILWMQIVGELGGGL